MKQRRNAATRLVPLKDAAEWVRRLTRKLAKESQGRANGNVKPEQGKDAA
jgi:hypothetical protein